MNAGLVLTGLLAPKYKWPSTISANAWGSYICLESVFFLEFILKKDAWILGICREIFCCWVQDV